jgi:predicted PurR-regulated permease PerM
VNAPRAGWSALPSNAGTRLLITVACFIIIIAGMKIAAPVLIRLALALFLVIVTRPAIAFLQRRRVPTVLAITLVVLLTFAVLATLVSVATTSLSEIGIAFPRYVSRYQLIEGSFLEWLRHWGIEVPPAIRPNLISATQAVDLASGAIRGAAGVTSTAALVLIIAIFGMLEANELPAKLNRAFGTGAVTLQRLSLVVHEVQHYLRIKTAISMATGILVGVWVWLVGLDFPVFWGLVAFVLNYVPSVGSIIAAIPAVLLALVQIGPDAAFLTTLGYLAVNVALGNFLEPTLLGRRLNLSPLVVILSLVFWGWLWGPIGILLSVPLTMSCRMLLENSDDYRWIATLLAPAREDSRRPGTTMPEAATDSTPAPQPEPNP